MRKVEEIVTSDVTGQRINADDAVRISVFKGTDKFIVDLDGANLDSELAQLTLADVCKHEHYVEPESRPRVKRRGPQQPNRSAQVREWARENGIEVPDRGRIPYHVVDLFDASTQH